MKYAKRLALIAPRGAGGGEAGYQSRRRRSRFQHRDPGGLDVIAPLYAATTEVGKQFDEIKARDGFKAALKWRRDQFKA